MDNENKNEELFDEASAIEEIEENDQPDVSVEPEQPEQPEQEQPMEPETEQSVEDETVERLNAMGDEIDAEDLGGIPVTPPDDDSVDEETESELCVMCGEKPADKSFGEDYDLCADCRKRLVKAPISFASILFFILIIGVCFFGFLLSASQLSTLQAVSDAYDQAGSNHLYSAIKSLSSAGNIGWKTAKKAVSLYNDSGYLSGIASMVDAYFYDASASSDTKLTWADKVGKGNLNAPWNKKVKKISSDYNVAMDAYEKYYAYFSEYDEQLYYGEITVKDVPYDDLIKKYEEAKQTENESSGLAFISYCEWYLANMCEKGLETELQYMKGVQEAAPDFTWLYLTKLTELQINTGDYEAAEANCKRMLEINADDYYGEYYRAMILRRQGKYDEAIEMMDAVIADYENNGFYYAYYEAGINAFLKNDIKKALSYIKVCYEGEYLNYNTANFYALLNKLDNNEEEYQAALDMISSNQAQLSPTVEKYLKKQITAEEMFNGVGNPFEQPAAESEAAE